MGLDGGEGANPPKVWGPRMGGNWPSTSLVAWLQTNWLRLLPFYQQLVIVTLFIPYCATSHHPLIENTIEVTGNDLIAIYFQIRRPDKKM